MNNLYANIINETQKIFKKRKTVVLLIITALIPFFGAVLSGVVGNRIGADLITPAQYPLTILGMFVNFLLPLFIFAAAADIFAGETGDGSLKLVLIRPISRLNIYISKIIAVVVFAAVNLALVFIVSLISSMLININGFEFAGFLKGIEAYAAAIVPMLCLTIIASFISQFFKSGSGALTTCVLIYIASKAVPFIIPKLSGLLPFSYTGWHTMWLGSMNLFGNILTAFMILLSYSIIFFASGYYFFDKKEI